MPQAGGRIAAHPFGLRLDDGPSPGVSLLRNGRGGRVFADVLRDALPNEQVVDKHLGARHVADFVVEFAGLTSSGLFEWIASSWAATPPTRDGALLVCASNYTVVLEQAFDGAIIAETVVPAFDAANKSPAAVTVRFVSPSSIGVANPGGSLAIPLGKGNVKLWLASNFKLEIDDIDCTKVSRIDGFTVRREVEASTGSAGTTLIAGPIDFPNLRVYFSAASAATWTGWYQDFVIDGNDSPADERTGTIRLLAAPVCDDDTGVALGIPTGCESGPWTSPETAVRFAEKDIKLPGPEVASETQRYVRFEPVPSPTVLRRHVDTEGESLEHLVIRSDDGVAAGDLCEVRPPSWRRSRMPSRHTRTRRTRSGTWRRPKGSQLMAEQDVQVRERHSSGPAQATAALRTALREAGTFLEESVIDTTTGQKTIAQSPIETVPAGLPLPDRGQPLGDGAYAIHPGSDVVLPYLPDPLAVGVAMTGFDHTGAEVFHAEAPFAGAWPDLAPFRLRLSESIGPPTAQFVGGIFEVKLPKAEVIRAQLSSLFPDGRLADLAIWAWTPEADRTATLEDAAVHGRHWMLTPFRWITFTHAVQHPLAVPDMTDVTHYRLLGDTNATFQRWIACHARSTGRLDVYATWTEDVDLLTDDLPRTKALGTEVHHDARGFGWEIGPGEDKAPLTATGRLSRHEFGDTKYRRVLYHSVATTRFREYLPRPIADDPDAIIRVEPTEDANGTERKALVHHVRSTARPAAPDVMYVLPTFRWDRTDEGPIRTHVRHGSSLRVWLRRPWFSSGDGELLGVVLEPGSKVPRGWKAAATGVSASAAATKAATARSPAKRGAPVDRGRRGPSGGQCRPRRRAPLRHRQRILG